MLFSSLIRNFTFNRCSVFFNSDIPPHTSSHSISQYNAVYTNHICSLWSQEYIWGRGKPRHDVASSACHTASHHGLKNVFQFLRGTVHSIHTAQRRGIPRACLTLIYRHARARIVTASEACSSARCTIYTSRGEAAAPCLGLPLAQVYSQLETYTVTSLPG